MNLEQQIINKGIEIAKSMYIYDPDVELTINDAITLIVEDALNNDELDSAEIYDLITKNE